MPLVLDPLHEAVLGLVEFEHLELDLELFLVRTGTGSEVHFLRSGERTRMGKMSKLSDVCKVKEGRRGADRSGLLCSGLTVLVKTT